MDRLATATRGRPGIRIALLDGPVDLAHPLLPGGAILQTGRAGPPHGRAGRHATMLASMLVGIRGPTLGLCADCTLLSIPVVDDAFAEGRLTSAEAAARVAAGIGEALRRGADVLQLSLAFDPEQGRACAEVVAALAAAAARGVAVVVAAGNLDHLAANPLLRAPGAIGVAAADAHGLPMTAGVCAHTAGLRGLLAPGDGIPGALPPSTTGWSAGSSVAASFVTAAYALLRCRFPSRPPADVLRALIRPHPAAAIRSVVPPRLDADASASLLYSTVQTSERTSYDCNCRQ